MSDPFESIRNVDPALAGKLDTVHTSLIRSHAQSAAHRLAVAAEGADDLQPEALFQAVDPGRAVGEVEEAEGRLARRLGALRNVLALLPLLLTWIALGYATIEYQRLVASAPDDVTRLKYINEPFLLLWQQGFNHTTPFTFAATAVTDFALLLLLVIVTVMAQSAEGAASRRVQKVAAQLDDATQALAVATARHSLRLSPNAQPEEWVRAVQKVVDQAMRQTESLAARNEQVVEEATKVLQGIRQDTQDLMQQQMSPLVDRFRSNLSDLHDELTRYHQSASQLVGTVGQLATAATSLASSSSSYTSVASSIDNNLQSLAQTQSQYVGQFSSAAKGLTDAADTVNLLATQLGQQVNQQIVANLDVATRHLSEVELRLAQTALELQRASQLLQRASVARTGLLGLLFGSSK